jgi:hypothetical protein
MTQQAAGSTGSEELGVAVGENRDKWGLGGRRRNRTHSAPDREGIAGAVVEVAIVSMKMSRRRKEEEERETDLVLVGMMRTARLRLLASLSLDNSFIAVVGNSTPVSTSHRSRQATPAPLSLPFPPHQPHLTSGSILSLQDCHPPVETHDRLLHPLLLSRPPPFPLPPLCRCPLAKADEVLPPSPGTQGSWT